MSGFYRYYKAIFVPIMDFMEKTYTQRIRSFLPFARKTGVWRRIEELESECEMIVQVMLQLAAYFREVVSEPREIYLCVQEVKSTTMYIRWRRRGVKGDQSYLSLNSIHGKSFLLRQSADVARLYRRFDRWALDLNLAHSLRKNEVRRLKKYINDITLNCK